MASISAHINNTNVAKWNVLQWQYLDTSLITACVSNGGKKNPLYITGYRRLSPSLKEIYSPVSRRVSELSERRSRANRRHVSGKMARRGLKEEQMAGDGASASPKVRRTRESTEETDRNRCTPLTESEMTWKQQRARVSTRAVNLLLNRFFFSPPF